MVGDVFKSKMALYSRQLIHVGSVMVLEAMSPKLNYFEYEIVDNGRETAIGIGVGEREYPLGRMPGWDENSIGYHADDGNMFLNGTVNYKYGPLCSLGDRMGCGIDYNNPRATSGHVFVFFTKNGKQVGKLVSIRKLEGGLFPIIGLDNGGEKVRYLGQTQV